MSEGLGRAGHQLVAAVSGIHSSIADIALAHFVLASPAAPTTGPPSSLPLSRSPQSDVP